jgi:hypothetical protein
MEVDCPWVMAFPAEDQGSECINEDKYDLTDLVAAHGAQNDPALCIGQRLLLRFLRNFSDNLASLLSIWIH